MIDTRASILIVDDERPLCETLKDLLERRGHRVDFRTSAAEAVEAAGCCPYQIVMLDVRLPDLSGLDLIEKLEELLPGADLLVMTGYSSLESAQRSVRKSVAGYFNKPLDLEHFLPLVDSIAERKTLELRNRSLEAFTKSVVRNVPAVIYSMTSDQRLTLISPQCLRLFGYSESEFLSRPSLWNKVVHPEDVRLREQLSETCVDGGSFALEYRVVSKSGETRWVHDSGSVTFGSTRQEFRLDGTLTDITEHKKVEEQVLRLNEDLERRVQERTGKLEAANKELEAFAYSVSHDLRAPLRAIHGFAEILRRRHKKNLSPDAARCLENILEAGALMGSLIEDLLTYSRLGRRAVRCESFPLGRVVERTLASLQNQIEAAGAEIARPAPESLVFGDETLISRILVNLLQNSLTYRRPEVATRIAIEFAARNDQMHLTVRDNGIGIPLEYQREIFEVFHRLHSGNEHPGTGIGLAIVKKSAELLGGDIKVESTVGSGSSFRLTWWPCRCCPINTQVKFES